MKKLLTTVALLSAMFAASPALADEADDLDEAYGYLTVLFYGKSCESLPLNLTGPVAGNLLRIPDAIHNRAQDKVDAAMRAEGLTAWCANRKPRMDKFLAEEGLR